jgi:hypothetical protein
MFSFLDLKLGRRSGRARRSPWRPHRSVEPSTCRGGPSRRMGGEIRRRRGSGISRLPSHRSPCGLLVGGGSLHELWWEKERRHGADSGAAAQARRRADLQIEVEAVARAYRGPSATAGAATGLLAAAPPAAVRLLVEGGGPAARACRRHRGPAFRRRACGPVPHARAFGGADAGSTVPDRRAGNPFLAGCATGARRALVNEARRITRCHIPRARGRPALAEAYPSPSTLSRRQRPCRSGRPSEGADQLGPRRMTLPQRLGQAGSESLSDRARVLRGRTARIRVDV